jgi:hypothetical protein
MKAANRFQLSVIAEKWTLSKINNEADLSEFQLPQSIKGWAFIRHKEIVLFRTDKSEPTPRQIRLYYTRRFPKRPVTDRYEHTHREVFTR